MNISSVLGVLAFGVSFCIPASAQDIDFYITVPDTAGYQNVSMYVSSSQSSRPLALHREGNVYHGRSAATPSHFYNISMNDRERQLSFPIYSDEEKCDIELTSVNMDTQRKTEPGINRAIAEYEVFMSAMARKSGGEFLTMPDNQIKDEIISLVTVADSLIGAYGLQGDQAEFMRIWGEISANSVLTSVEYLSKHQNRSLPFNASTLLGAPETILDTPMALWFYDTPNIIMMSLDGRTIPEQLSSLFDKYSTHSIRDKVKMNLANQYISSHNYVEHFDDGRQQLQDMIALYGLPESLLKEYDGRRATIAGTPFPDDVVLIDATGSEVPFSKFAGKYVYVDLWASWCGPCCKEVPHLQALEKELGRDDVAFLSISLDSNKDAWLSRMRELNMHGNQVLDSDGRLAEKLNVSSIPHFLLYGPDGKLISYKTSRPSHSATREMLLALPETK